MSNVLQDYPDRETLQPSPLIDEYLLRDKGEEPAAAAPRNSEVGVIFQELPDLSFLDEELLMYYLFSTYGWFIKS